MTESLIDAAGADAASLLVHYSFDLDGYTVDTLVRHWLRQHSSLWLRMAVIEALYQGRYKAVSVEQILTLWQRRGQPRHHFNREFERMVCSKLPRNLLTESAPQESAQAGSMDTPPRPESPTPTIPALSEAAKPIQETPESIVPIIDRPAPPPPSDDSSLAMATLWETVTLTEGWSNREVVKHPIHQFVPTDSSNFSAKLRAVSQPVELESSSTTAAVLEIPDEERSPDPIEQTTH
ncbi:MAG: hypothetical protein HC881_18035 [Leptolyngbyaceae cyanobacterium SL_7_1]|nr:hypothetical protein [Leptolyngbyaceae cyanobacterium SL_7_1]